MRPSRIAYTRRQCAERGWAGIGHLTEPFREFWQIWPARLSVTARIDRCAATNVDPASGARDMNIPKALQRGFGHPNMGVYATVIAGGPVSVGDEIRVPA